MAGRVARSNHGAWKSGLSHRFWHFRTLPLACLLGGVSGHTRLVLRPSSDDGHEAANVEVFQEFLKSVEDGADLILNKVQGAEGHGGGVQVVPGSADFANLERFLRALGGSTASDGLSPETLFDGVTMASPARILRRAALLFAGKLPTSAELEAVRAGSDASLRKAIPGADGGPGIPRIPHPVG